MKHDDLSLTIVLGEPKHSISSLEKNDISASKVVACRGGDWPPGQMLYTDQYVLISVLLGAKCPSEIHLEYLEYVGRRRVLWYFGRPDKL